MDAFAVAEHDFRQTAEILKRLPGGLELLDWFGGEPNFGDGEVVSLTLDRSGASELRVFAAIPRTDAAGR